MISIQGSLVHGTLQDKKNPEIYVNVDPHYSLMVWADIIIYIYTYTLIQHRARVSKLDFERYGIHLNLVFCQYHPNFLAFMFIQDSIGSV